MPEQAPTLDEIEASRQVAESGKEEQGIEYIDPKSGIRHLFKTKEELMRYKEQQNSPEVSR